mgnify:CR=1 FL=1
MHTAAGSSTARARFGRESEIGHRSAAAFQPWLKARADISGKFELDRPTPLLLHNDRARPDVGAGNDLADPDLEQIATA